MGQGGFDLPPRHPIAQYGQRVLEVDHLLQAGTKKVVSHRFIAGLFLSGFYQHYFNS
jgi:hypothetical protein